MRMRRRRILRILDRVKNHIFRTKISKKAQLAGKSQLINCRGPMGTSLLGITKSLGAAPDFIKIEELWGIFWVGQAHHGSSPASKCATEENPLSTDT